MERHPGKLRYVLNMHLAGDVMHNKSASLEYYIMHNNS